MVRDEKLSLLRNKSANNKRLVLSKPIPVLGFFSSSPNSSLPPYKGKPQNSNYKSNPTRILSKIITSNPNKIFPKLKIENNLKSN